MEIFNSSFEYKLIYIFQINDNKHKGLLKIGDATIKTNIEADKLVPNCRELNQAALNRIKSYTNTAGIDPILLYTELAIKKIEKNGKEKLVAFRDHDVHKVLMNSNIKKAEIVGSTSKEWFSTTLDVAVKAIDAVKHNYYNLSNTKFNVNIPIIFRPEQELAIKKTIDIFKTSNKMLWNAKMRFGKTLTALEVIKKLNFKKSIIITHRPVVDDGWFEDFNKIFQGDNNYIYGSKNKGYDVESLKKSNKNFVYFASIQDLRGSDLVGGKYNKNNDVFDLEWDFVIVDEAHEGTTTSLGDEVIKAIVKHDKSPKTKFLALSGTPFNILTDYEESNIYTWDYIMEQSAKHDWSINHFGDSNPYDELPQLKILTYDLGKIINNESYQEIDDKAFNFKELFRVWTGNKDIDFKDIPTDKNIGDFVHENDIISFLNLITKNETDSNYPYSKKEYRDLFKHSLWMVPGVKEAKALSILLKKHPIFSGFDIVNVAGDGDEDVQSDDALRLVRKAINDAGEDGYTITLSCGKLTTGVTVPEWTAVMMLSGSYSTSAANYLQTIFRVQSPCNMNGKIKTTSYVFDFAPDRTLKMVAESVAISTKAGKTQDSDKIILGKFLNFCPVISIEGTKMLNYNTTRLLQQLKRAYAERAVKNGFDDVNLYNDELLRLDGVALEEFQKLKGIIGTSKAAPQTNEIDINNQGFTNEEYEEKERIEKKPVRERTPEELAKLEELKQRGKNKKNAISILRGISIRMPLLIYGADVSFTNDISIEQLTDLVDDSSWTEFMPEGVTKEVFKNFIKYYDSEVFIAAGRKIRNTVKQADECEPLEKVLKISQLFSCFKNPDKETVLTPWNVVNRHMSDTLGGYNFYNDTYTNILDKPRFVDNGVVTAGTITNNDVKILEINSKTGLYPLYITYSIYQAKCDKKESLSISEKKKIWNETVEQNIYVICKTPMAKAITKRTLIGFDDIKVNAHYFEDLINYLKNKPDKFVERVLKTNYWEKGGYEKMKFDAIVGNPPYQEQDNGTNEDGVSRTSAISVYNYFVQTSKKVTNQYVSLIIPSRWMTGGRGLDSFRKENMSDRRFSLIHDYENDQEIFPNTDIGGGIMYFLWDSNHDGELDYYLHNNESIEHTKRFLDTGDSIIIRDYASAQIMKKIILVNSFANIVSSRKPFSFGADITRKKPEMFSDKITDDKNVKFYCWDKIPLIKYISENDVSEKKLMKCWKVFISKTADPPIRQGRANKDILRTPFIGEPNTACSETYLTIGCFETKDEANAVLKYVKTKFLRFLVLQKKKTQNVSKGVFDFVPSFDFSDNSIINWTLPINEINKQLYEYYKLSDDEISYIEEKISEMN